MTGVAGGIALEVVLVLRLSLPKVPGLGNLGHHFARPQPRGIDVGDGLLSDPLLFIAGVEDCRAIACAGVIALAIPCTRVVNLKEELENLTVAELGRVKDDLDGLGMGSVISIGRVAHVAARVADPCRYHAIVTSEQILHPPEAAAGQNRTFL